MNIQTSFKSHGLLIGEPSFADAITTIRAAHELDEKTKRYYSSSLLVLARYLGESPETIPARIAAIAHRVRQLHAERLGKHAKTFANNRALAKKALNWFNKHTLGSARSAPMGEEYRQLWDKITDKYAKDMLSPFLRFLTGLGVQLPEVNDEHVTAYVQYRRETKFRTLKPHQVRQLVRYWNGCGKEISGWPDIILAEPARIVGHDGPALDEFPPQLCEDINAHCGRLSREREDEKGRLLDSCAETTIELRRRMIIAAVRMAVRSGIPLASIDSLGALLKPAMVEKIIDAYWKRDGKLPKTYTIDLGTKFLTMARSEANLAPEDIAQLARIARVLERHRKKGLTPKNREVIRLALQDGSWAKVVQLPRKLMAKADARRRTSPVTSAVLAQMAIAIRILLVAPVRIENLAEIKIGENLVRPGGPRSLYFLTFERYDVKNDISLDFELDALTSDLIDRYVMDHRPNLMRGRNHNFLFPGLAGDKKGTVTFGEQISKCLWKHLGIRLTPHQRPTSAAPGSIAMG